MTGKSSVPMRGEVWDVKFPAPANEHPAVVLSANGLRLRSASVTVVLITGTEGPEQTHVALDTDAGVSRYAVSYANATDLHTVPTARLRHRRGLLSASEMATLEAAVRLALDL